MIRPILPRLAKVAVFVMVACNGQMIVEEDPEEDPEGEPSGGSEPFAGNAPDCPARASGTGAPCGVAEGQACVFDEPDMFNAGYVNHQICGCYEAGGSSRQWYCSGGSSGPWECPGAQPSNGASCYGLYGAECTYPSQIICYCSADSGSWSCEDAGRTNIPAPPTSVPPGVPINALTDEERAVWCAWYRTTFNGPGYPDEPPAAIDANGYTVNTGCNLGWEFPCLAMVPTLGSSDCEANLGLSACAAPISELSDCLVTVIDSCSPSPHGCPRYLEKPGCDGTIVVANGNAGAGGTSSTGGGTSTGGGFTTGGTGAGGRAGLGACSVRVR